MTTQLEARAFAIWRYANPRQWDCSYHEIADATGLTYNQVAEVIKQKRWGGRIGRSRGRVGTSQGAALAQKTKGHRFDENALDVVQLMGVTA